MLPLVATKWKFSIKTHMDQSGQMHHSAFAFYSSVVILLWLPV